MSTTKSRGRTDERRRVQLLDEEGRLLPDVEPPSIPDETLLGIYESMRMARHFDERAMSIQRQGRIATYAPMTGQEASQVASAYALEDHDWVYPTYRDNAAKIVRGVDPADILASLRGCGTGYAGEEGINVMPEYIPIATQIPQATGAAWAEKLSGSDAAVVCYFGDGATSEGDFHEGLNFAGVFDVPAVFFCNNNQWAISMPREQQTASETLSQKAEAYGFEGIQVDGMDPLAVYQVTRAALEKARNPGPDELRPTMIEAVQYRLGPHTSSDDPSRYRDEDTDEWEERDPLDRMETYLREQGILDDERESAIETRVETRVADAIERAEEVSEDPASMFEHVYEEPTPALEDQHEELERLREEYGDEALIGDD